MSNNNDPDKAGEKSFLRRWSERKIGKSGALEPKLVSQGTESSVEGSISSDQQMAEAVDYPELPDLPELQKLFKRPGISMLDGLNEYDGDYSHYVNLSDILTHEMKRVLARSLSEGGAESDATEEPKTQDSGSSIPAEESVSLREPGPEEDV